MARLAREGFDVFTLDMTGYGRSGRPCRLIPAMLPQHREGADPPDAGRGGPPGSPFALVDFDSETADIDAVVDFIRRLRGVDRVKLIGWSGGGIGTGTRRAPPGQGRSLRDLGLVQLQSQQS